MKIDRFILSCLFVLLASTMLRAEADGLSRATEQLAAGQYAEARDAFLAITAQDPRNATALHGAGIAMLQLGDTARALQQLQRAHTLRPTDRAISINYAAALIRSRNPMRAVRVLIDVQPAPERPLDEPLLDALQYALSVADENARKNRLFTEGQAAANAMVARLESARPGWKRFGSSWRLAAEVDAIVARNEAKRARVQTLVADGVKAERQLQQLRAEARVIEKRVQHGFDWPGRLDAHMERVRDTERQIERVRQEIEQTEAEIIPPPAPAPLEPVAMDSTAPPFENWSAPADPSPLAPPLFQEDADNAPRDPPAIATPPSAPPVAAPPAAPAEPAAPTRHAAALAITRSQLVIPAGEIAGATLIEIRRGAGRPMTARHVRTDRQTGLAVLEIAAGDLRPAPLAPTTAAGRVTMIDFPSASLFDVIARARDAELLAAADCWQLAESDASLMSGAVLASEAGVIGMLIDVPRRTVLDVGALRAMLGNAPQGAQPAHDPADAVYHVTVTVAR